LKPGFGKDIIADELAKAFPAERDNLVKFWDDVEGTKGQLWRLIKAEPGKMSSIGKMLFNVTFPLKFGKIAKYHRKKASEVIARYFSAPALRQALNAYGIFPDISFVHYSWFNSVTLDSDAYYPHGGIQAVPDALAERFVKKGGEIRYKAEAEKIIVENKKAAGVMLKGGDALHSATVISAGDAKNTFINMVDKEHLPKEFMASVEEWKASESFFYVYLGVDMDLKAMGFDGTPIWYFPKEMDRKSFPMLGNEAVGIGMPSVLDPSLCPEGKGIVILGITASCTFMSGCPVRAGGNKDAYRTVKEKIGDYLVDIAAEAIPGLKERIEVKVVASPHTFERYTMNYLGASSGWSMAADQQNKLSIKTPIPGLLMAGHWTMNPGGVPAAFVSGKLVAEEIR
jgi:phytoene dehydrogenase-like protein